MNSSWHQRATPASGPTTRSQSFASTSSTDNDLSDNARIILNSLYNDRDFTQLSQYVSEDVTVQHNDNQPLKSRDAFLQSWQKALRLTPNSHVDIKEACVDEKQMKVWVRSEITGLPGGIRKESIDMMSFNEEGVLISSVDCQRIIRACRDDD